MPGKVAKIGSFSEWVGVFNEWRKEVGVNKDDVEAFHFDTLYGAMSDSQKKAADVVFRDNANHPRRG